MVYCVYAKIHKVFKLTLYKIASMQHQYFTDNKNKIFPFMTSLIYLSLITTAVMNMLKDNLALRYLEFDTVLILKQYQIWRIFSNTLNQPSFVAFLFVILFSYHWMSKFERKNGTVVLFTNYLIYNMFFNIFLLGFLAIFYFLEVHVFDIKIGILFMWINMFYKFCHFNRQSSLAFFSIPTRLIPLLILVVIMGVDREIRIDGLAGLILGFLQCKFFRGGLISFTKQTYTDKETVADYICLSQLCCWCKLYPQNLIMSELAVIQEYQFYEDLDPENPIHFEENSLDAERIYKKDQKQMEKDYDQDNV